jgi:lipoprotein-anchoring transpeptidase ErfK/SrfK
VVSGAVPEPPAAGAGVSGRAFKVLLCIAAVVPGVLASLGVAGTGPAATFETTTTSTTTTTAPAPQVLPEGVTIGGVQVGGLAPEEAYAAVRAAFERPLRIQLGRRRLAASPESLGAVAYALKAVDRARVATPGTALPLPIAVDGRRVRAYVGLLAEQNDRKPADAQLFLRRARPWISPERSGRVLDRLGAVRSIVSALTANRKGPLTLRSKVLTPAVTRKAFGPVIVIRRGSNRLDLYRGMHLWRAFGVATGQSVYPTPLGRFSIVVMWKNPWWYPPNSPWAQGEKPTPPGPGNPLGTRWMGLSAPGVGIHGTPNDGSIGYSVSHGCIRMHIPDAEWLFLHVSIGTTVFIVAA